MREQLDAQVRLNEIRMARYETRWRAAQESRAEAQMEILEGCGTG